jgi:hypothetical protein
MREMNIVLCLCLLLSACTAVGTGMVSTPPGTDVGTGVVTTPPTATFLPTQTLTPEAQPTPTATLPATEPPPTATVTPTLPPVDWREMPVVPQGISTAALDIYRKGLDMGNNPRAFSKIGDCETRTVWFLAEFDARQPAYDLGTYTSLKGVIDYYRASFARLSMSALPSFNAASVMSPMWADKLVCLNDESPAQCEFRLWKPSVALVMLGTNDTPHPERFEANLRKVIEFAIQQGVLPVLATKADNLEGDHSINAIIVRLAQEYQVPLWNYWRAVQGLPNGGLQEDGAHLTLGPNHFGDPAALKTGWAVRNLTALQVLEALVMALNSGGG